MATPSVPGAVKKLIYDTYAEFWAEYGRKPTRGELLEAHEDLKSRKASINNHYPVMERSTLEELVGVVRAKALRKKSKFFDVQEKKLKKNKTFTGYIGSRESKEDWSYEEHLRRRLKSIREIVDDQVIAEDNGPGVYDKDTVALIKIELDFAKELNKVLSAKKTKRTKEQMKDSLEEIFTIFNYNKAG